MLKLLPGDLMPLLFIYVYIELMFCLSFDSISVCSPSGNAVGWPGPVRVWMFNCSPTHSHLDMDLSL